MEQDKELGRIRLNDTTEVVIRQTEFKGQHYIDVRKYLKSATYTGWTKQGISIPVGQFEELLAILKGVELEG